MSTIRSMTGYGAASVETDEVRASVSVRSLNHRFLDISVHLSHAAATLESDVKSAVQARIARGRVEVSVHAVLHDEATAVSVASPALVTSLVRVMKALQAEHGLEGGVRVTDVARYPGVLEVIEAPGGVSEPVRERVLAVVEQALDGLEGMRRAEGERLASDLGRSLAAIEAASGRLEGLAEAGKAARHEALLAKARGLVAELGLEEARLYQEVVRLVDRNDVSEELQRLRSHLSQARELMQASGPAGKKLDFLAQELMREANTVGSKAASAALVQEVVAVKSEIERFREQVQNVE
jgi:uncharacterized protein (TIGR00255 family)